jgi:hypothetical protein
MYGCGCTCDSLANPTLDVVGVGEEEPIIEPIDQYSGNDSGGGMESYVGVSVQSLDPTEYRVVWSCAAADRVYDGEGDGEQ